MAHPAAREKTATNRPSCRRSQTTPIPKRYRSSASLCRLDMQNAQQLPKLSTDSNSFEFQFDVTA